MINILWFSPHHIFIQHTSGAICPGLSKRAKYSSGLHFIFYLNLNLGKNSMVFLYFKKTLKKSINIFLLSFRDKTVKSGRKEKNKQTNKPQKWIVGKILILWNSCISSNWTGTKVPFCILLQSTRKVWKVSG